MCLHGTLRCMNEVQRLKIAASTKTITTNQGGPHANTNVPRATDITADTFAPASRNRTVLAASSDPKNRTGWNRLIDTTPLRLTHRVCYRHSQG